MQNYISGRFAWELFENTGNIESYLIYRELNNLDMRIEDNEKHTDNGTCAENL